MEHWFNERLGQLRIRHESLRHEVHWALFEAPPEDGRCRSLREAEREGQFDWGLESGARAFLLGNRGRPVAVFRGEPVPGTGGRHAFAETRLVETGERARIPIRPCRSLPRGGPVVEAAGDLLRECLPARADCGLVVVVRGRLVRLEWFGHPHLFRARAAALLWQAAVAGLASEGWAGDWVPGEALAALWRIRTGPGRALGGAWFRPFRLDGLWGTLVGRGERLLHLRLARPDVFARAGSRDRGYGEGGRRHAAS